MILFDHLFGWMKWYRRMRGGTWEYLCCPDGGWHRKEKSMKEFPLVENYDN